MRTVLAHIITGGLLLCSAPVLAQPQAAIAQPASAGVINVNSATPDQLQYLPGIGEARARAIVELRQRRPFARVEDLLAVRGIGRATLRRLRPYLAIRGDTTLTRPVRAAPEPTTPRPTSPRR